MPNEPQHEPPSSESISASAKKFYLTSRGLVESILREYDLGPTQYYVLYQLVNDGPTLQRDIGQVLNIERATLSSVVPTLVRKGLISQEPDAVDQRQRLIRLTDPGRKLWDELPDPIARTEAIAFAGADPAELALARRVLHDAKTRLDDHLAAHAGPST